VTLAAADPATALIERVEALRRSQLEQAHAELERGFREALRGAPDARRGELWRLRGHVQRARQRPRDAARAYAVAERWYARAGEVRERGRCAIGLTDALMYLGRYAEAARAAARGRRLLERAGDRVSLARLLNNEGNLWHRLDLPERALHCYRAARRALAGAGDRRGAAMVDGNVANCLSLVGRLGEARALYTAARREHQAQGFTLDALTADYNLAYLDFLEHHDEAALAGLARSREQAEAHGSPSIAALASLDRAEIYLRLGAHEEALTESARAITAFQSLEMAYERGKAETFAALAEFRLGRTASARERLERTLAAFHAEGNRVWTGEALVGLATLWWREGNPRAAAALLAAARRQFRGAGDREREGCALALLARASLAGADRRRAARALSALAARRGPRESPRLRHLALAAGAAAAHARGDVAAARSALSRAARASERLAARILDEHWRATFWGEWGWPHRELASLELEQGRIDQALEALEAGRGRALVGPIAHGRRVRGQALPRHVRTWAAARLAGERLRGERSAAAPGGEAVVTPGSRPAGGALRRALESRPPRTVRAAALRRTLAPDALLVDYMLHDGWIHAIAVARDGLQGHRALESEVRIAQRVHALLFELRGAAFAGAGAAVTRDLDETLSSIAASVLWPLLPRGRGRLPHTLAVVPAGPLQRVPWAALPLPDGRRLGEACEVVVVPGLRLGLLRARDRVPPRRGAPLVVASDAGELPQVAAEARAVLEAFPQARLLADDQATAESFLRLAPRASWIHFAGHGHFRADAPHESGLRFADRWLLAGELAELDLGARWVTLSACQTARALVRPGEEWFGLPRALLIAGAHAVLASQWDIEDGAASRLTGALYRNLASGHGLSDSLGTVQSDRLQSGDHPLNWAGFGVFSGPPTAPSRRTKRRPREGGIAAPVHGD
jgi:tetratricopeptide (TPR) repeat protein